MAIRFAVLLVAFAVPAVLGYSTGAPKEVCDHMTPQHKPDGVNLIAPQTDAPKYKILLSSTEAKTGAEVEVTIKGNSNADTIKGFICEARVGTEPIGEWKAAANAQALDCGTGKHNAVTHKKIEGDIDTIQLTWVSPSKPQDKVDILCTVAHNGGVFWVKIPSDQTVKVI